MWKLKGKRQKKHKDLNDKGTLRSYSIETNRIGWVGFFTRSIGNKRLSVGSVVQLFQPTRNPVELVENDGNRPLSQSWALIRCVMSTNTILFNTVGVWCPLSPGINSFNRKHLKCVLFSTLQPHQSKPILVEMVIPNRTRPKMLTLD